MTPNPSLEVPRSSGVSQSSRLDSTDTNEAYERLNKKFLRLVISGKTVEAFWTSKPVLTHRVLLKKPRPRKKKNQNITPERRAEYIAWSVHRAKETARKLALTNFDPINSKLLTLTFAPTSQFDVTSPADCHQKFKNFMAKLKRHYPKFKYIASGEFQTTNKRMAVHYHLLVNLPFVKWERLTKLWGWGGLDIEMGDNSQMSKIAYITKYITKDNPYTYKNHRYFASKSLKKPLTFYGNVAENILEKCRDLGYIPGYQSSYANAFLGETDYTEYNLPQVPALKETS